MKNRPKSSNRHGIAPENKKQKTKNKNHNHYETILLKYNITGGGRSNLLEPRHAS